MNVRYLSRMVGASILSVITAAGAAHGQVVTIPAAPTQGGPQFSSEEIEQLVGPIALYPDPLVAQILPASTYPIDIVKAARMVRAGAAESQIDARDWDPSVKAVAHYPSVIDMMDGNIDWTQRLGEAFMAQPGDVMQAIQRLRRQARDLGNLADIPQEQVCVEDDAIRIFPTNPAYICVPTYEPSIVFFRRPQHRGEFVTFSVGLAVGVWLDLDCDWHGHYCYRPGWTWNHWHDNIVVEHERVVRVVRPVPAQRGGEMPGVWHRDLHKPVGMPGNHGARPSEFDRFRGREGEQRAHPAQAPKPAEIDRGRERTPAARDPGHPFDPRQRDDQTQKFSNRGHASQQSPAPSPVKPTPAPKPAPKPAPAPKPPQQPAPKPAPQPTPQPTPKPAPQPAPKPPPQSAPKPAQPPAPKPAPSRPQGPANPPARVTPPPVKIPPPPPAAKAPSPPPFTTGGPAGDRGKNDRGPH